MPLQIGRRSSRGSASSALVDVVIKRMRRQGLTAREGGPDIPAVHGRQC